MFKIKALGWLLVTLIDFQLRQCVGRLSDSPLYIGAVTSDGLTPLGVAVREGHLDTIMYLIMDCNVDVSGKYT